MLFIDLDMLMTDTLDVAPLVTNAHHDESTVYVALELDTTVMSTLEMEVS